MFERNLFASLPAYTRAFISLVSLAMSSFLLLSFLHKKSEVFMLKAMLFAVYIWITELLTRFWHRIWECWCQVSFIQVRQIILGTVFLFNNIHRVVKNGLGTGYGLIVDWSPRSLIVPGEVMKFKNIIAFRIQHTSLLVAEVFPSRLTFAKCVLVQRSLVSPLAFWHDLHVWLF